MTEIEYLKSPFPIIVNNCCMENDIPDRRRFLHHPVHHFYNLWKGQSTTI